MPKLEEKGIDIDREKLSDLRFADDAAQTTESITDREHQLNTQKEESLKVVFKTHNKKANL